MPFSDVRGGVAILLKQLGQRYLLARQVGLGLGLEQALVCRPAAHGALVPDCHIEPRGRFASEDGRAGRRANRRGRVSLSEQHPLPGQPVDVGRFKKIAPHHPGIRTTPVIHKDEHHVKLLSTQRLGQAHGHGEHQERSHRQNVSRLAGW